MTFFGRNCLLAFKPPFDPPWPPLEGPKLFFFHGNVFLQSLPNILNHKKLLFRIFTFGATLTLPRHKVVRDVDVLETVEMRAETENFDER